MGPFCVLDGWWLEGYDGRNGWAIESPNIEPHLQDEHDGRELLRLLESEVLPLFYDRDADGIPRRWIERVKASMRSLIPQFTAERMLADYLRQMYLPS